MNWKSKCMETFKA